MPDPNNDDNNRQDRPGHPSGRGPHNQGPGGSGGSGGGRGPQNFMSRSAMWWLILAVVVVLLMMLFQNTQNQPKDISVQQFFNYAAAGAFDKDGVTLGDEQMTGTLKPGTEGQDVKPGANATTGTHIRAKISREDKVFYVAKLDKLGMLPHEDPGGSLLIPLIMYWGPFIVLVLLIYFFVFRSLRGSGGGPGGMLGSFGRSRHKVTNKEHSTITLNDVAGVDEAKEEVGEIIEFLKNPKKFQRLGGRVPRGVLLIGDPGCGKTLLAKAVAGEAEVPFFSISGSDFVEMFVGVGASRVRDLFKQAKDSSPCIIFLDEIDAVGRKRGTGAFSGGHDEREQTLNAILVEMDGFDTNDQVIVMAATNRADVLDPALTRPGRFDRQIHVSLPDIRGRMEILRVHSRRIKMGPDVNLEKLARGTPMFSGADLAAIINEAAIGATLAGKDFVEQDDLEEARDKVKWGRSRKSHKIEEKEKRIIAFHEAGHALVMYHDPDSDPLHKVTIIPRGDALGVTFMLPEKDKHIHTKRELMARLRVTFGGRIAEEMFCGDISSGAYGDIRQASSIARAMITQYGMSDKLGFLLYGMDESRNPWEQPDKLYSDDTAHMIDDEIHALIDLTYGETRQLLESHRDQLERLAEALLRYETLNRDDVDRLMRGEQLNKPTVGDLLKAEQAKKSPPKPNKPATPTLDSEGPTPMPTPA